MPLSPESKTVIQKIVPLALLQHMLSIFRILTLPRGRLASMYRYLRWNLYNRITGKPAIATLINGARTIVYPDSDSGVADLFLPNQYQELTYIRQRLPPGAFIVDAGCNVGNRTLSLSDRLSGALLLDANDFALARLNENFRLNNIELNDYHIIHAAVGDEAGEVEFTNFGGASTQNRIMDKRASNATAPPGATKVRVTTIDQELQKLGNPACHYIKTDVEGYDLKALQGATNTLLNNSVKLVYFERWKDVPLDDFVSFFESISWRVFTLDKKSNEVYKGDILGKVNNLFAEPIQPRQ